MARVPAEEPSSGWRTGFPPLWVASDEPIQWCPGRGAWPCGAAAAAAPGPAASSPAGDGGAADPRSERRSAARCRATVSGVVHGSLQGVGVLWRVHASQMFVRHERPAGNGAGARFEQTPPSVGGGRAGRPGAVTPGWPGWMARRMARRGRIIGPRRSGAVGAGRGDPRRSAAIRGGRPGMPRMPRGRPGARRRPGRGRPSVSYRLRSYARGAAAVRRRPPEPKDAHEPPFRGDRLAPDADGRDQPAAPAGRGAGEDVYEVKLGDEFLMSSLFTEGEIALTRLGLAELPDGPAGRRRGRPRASATPREPRWTTRGSARCVVVDALDEVIDWHRGHLVPLGAELTSDPRCRLVRATSSRWPRDPRAWTPRSPAAASTRSCWTSTTRRATCCTRATRPSTGSTGCAASPTTCTPAACSPCGRTIRRTSAFVARLREVFGAADARGHVVTFDNPMQGRHVDQHGVRRAGAGVRRGSPRSGR